MKRKEDSTSQYGNILNKLKNGNYLEAKKEHNEPKVYSVPVNPYSSEHLLVTPLKVGNQTYLVALEVIKDYDYSEEMKAEEQQGKPESDKQFPFISNLGRIESVEKESTEEDLPNQNNLGNQWGQTRMIFD